MGGWMGEGGGGLMGGWMGEGGGGLMRDEWGRVEEV